MATTKKAGPTEPEKAKATANVDTKSVAKKAGATKKPAVKAAKPKTTANEIAKKELTTKNPAARSTPVKKQDKAKKAEPKKVTKKPTQKEPEILEAPTMDQFPSLKKGSNETGPITFLQANLKQRGFYKGSIDGNFGPNTEKAVIEFQKALDKPVSGTVGPKTWEALQKSDVRAKVAAPVAAPQPQQQTGPGTRVLIEGLSKFQAELLVKLLSGHTECRIL